VIATTSAQVAARSASVRPTLRNASHLHLGIVGEHAVFVAPDVPGDEDQSAVAESAGE
jgi:hypothetical protein